MSVVPLGVSAPFSEMWTLLWHVHRSGVPPPPHFPSWWVVCSWASVLREAGPQGPVPHVESPSPSTPRPHRLSLCGYRNSPPSSRLPHTGIQGKVPNVQEPLEQQLPVTPGFDGSSLCWNLEIPFLPVLVASCSSEPMPCVMWDFSVRV